MEACSAFPFSTFIWPQHVISVSTFSAGFRLHSTEGHCVVACPASSAELAMACCAVDASTAFFWQMKPDCTGHVFGKQVILPPLQDMSDSSGFREQGSRDDHSIRVKGSNDPLAARGSRQKPAEFKEEGAPSWDYLRVRK